MSPPDRTIRDEDALRAPGQEDRMLDDPPEPKDIPSDDLDSGDAMTANRGTAADFQHDDVFPAPIGAAEHRHVPCPQSVQARVEPPQ